MIKNTHNEYKIISVDSGDIFTDKNYNSMLTSSWSKVSLGKSSNDTVAYSSADLIMAFVWKAVGFSYGSMEVGASGDI